MNTERNFDDQVFCIVTRSDYNPFDDRRYSYFYTGKIFSIEKHKGGSVIYGIDAHRYDRFRKTTEGAYPERIRVHALHCWSTPEEMIQDFQNELIRKS